LRRERSTQTRKAAGILPERRYWNIMQNISIIRPAKPAPQPRIAKESGRMAQAGRKARATQPSGLSREEVRQIVIDMIG
jgi:hypothetical protein